MNSSMFPLNCSVINTHLDSEVDIINLNQSLIIGHLNSSNFTQSFCYMPSNTSFSTIVDYIGNSEITMNQLHIDVIDQDDSGFTVWIYDQNNNEVEGVNFRTFLEDQLISHSVSGHGNGEYHISLNSMYKDQMISITVEKDTYLSNSIFLLYGERTYMTAPEAPILSSIIPNPSTDGTFVLTWNNVLYANEYQIYQSTTPITDISSMSPIAVVNTTSYTQTISTEGIYYFAVVAVGYVGDSDISNIQSVVINFLDPEPEPKPKIPGYSVFLLILLFNLMEERHGCLHIGRCIHHATCNFINS